MESWTSSFTYFGTLTYDEDSITYFGEYPALDKRHYQNHIKKLRKSHDIRYFGCGEYGSRFGRPHYHLVYFSPRELTEGDIQAAWDFGHISLRPCTDAGMAYAAKYVVKRHRDSEAVQAGQPPEFSTGSRRPMLGDAYLRQMADDLSTKRGRIFTAAQAEKVPANIRYQGKTYPLDRVARQKLAGYMRLPFDPSSYEAPEYDYDQWVEYQNRLVNRYAQSQKREATIATRL